MKQILILSVMLAAGLLGYVKEPKLRFAITGLKPDAASVRSDGLFGGNGPQIDPSTLTREQLPEKVRLGAEIQFTDEASGVTITVPAGSSVKLLRIDGSNAVVRAGENVPYSIVLPISKTDLMEQLAARPAAPSVPPAPSSPVPEPAPQTIPAQHAPAEPTPVPAPAPEPAPIPTPTGDSQEPAPVPAPIEEIKPTPTPALEPAPVPTTPADSSTPPEPQPAATTGSAPVTAGSADVVKLMQESIRGGQIKEFTSDQVLDWKAETGEKVNGEEFQIGSVTYKAETILGVKSIKAKAFIKDGKVQRWIWPKSDMEIK